MISWKNCGCETLLQAMSMIESIRGAFVELLDEVQWMDDETRRVAREKVSLQNLHTLFKLEPLLLSSLVNY